MKKNRNTTDPTLDMSKVEDDVIGISEHHIYIEALNQYENHLKDDSFPSYLKLGICSMVVRAIVKLYEIKINSYSDLSKYTPTIISEKPNTTNYFGFWWPRYDYKSRVETLKKLIEKTRP